MQFKATIANALWTASNLPAYRHFCRAVRDPQAVQYRKLRELVTLNANTAFGKAHGFDGINSYEEFKRRVPLSDYSTIEPWIARIRNGEANVLTRDTVTHLIPTSGSTGGRKLIPFTSGLQREFNAAIGPWLVDLARQFPEVMRGRAYWSITPVTKSEIEEHSVLPIGFDTDTAYLGSGRRLADLIMAVPPNAARTNSPEEFRYQTLLHLLLCRDLRLISVWHPSFLTLLLDALRASWERLIADIARGTDSTPARAKRARELHLANPLQPETIWPSLRVASCWGDAAAGLALGQLRRRFSKISLQPKGLIATEAFVTLPFQGQYPLAINSHFFEFIDDEGIVCAAENLRDQREYEVVVTTAGGLWRYRLGDRVRVTGWLEKTRSLQFIGRNNSVSDQCGEKLSEPFVAQMVREVFADASPAFALVAPDQDECGCRYTLYVEGNARTHWAEALDCALRRNPHYAYARDLGQLLPVRVFLIKENAYEAFTRRQAAAGTRLGEIKPAVLSRDSGWSEVFTGSYALPRERNPSLASA
jgi:hypothetical protein